METASEVAQEILQFCTSDAQGMIDELLRDDADEPSELDDSTNNYERPPTKPKRFG